MGIINERAVPTAHVTFLLLNEHARAASYFRHIQETFPCMRIIIQPLAAIFYVQ